MDIAMEVICSSNEQGRGCHSEPHTILIVEDDPDISYGLSTILEMTGYRVITAENGRQALELLTTGDQLPCVILLDLMMPVMDGWAFRGKQMQNEELAAIPVCVISGAKDLADEAQSLEVTEYLQKPFGQQAVMEKIEKFCPL